MVLVLHGVAGGWDELAIAVVALAVMWIAVKLAGRKPVADDDDDDQDKANPEDADTAVDEETDAPLPPPVITKSR